jgi:hypothetical protein
MQSAKSWSFYFSLKWGRVIFEIFEISWFSRFFEIFRDFSRFFEISRFSRFFEIFRDFSRFFEIFRDFSRYFEISRFFEKTFRQWQASLKTGLRWNGRFLCSPLGTRRFQIFRVFFKRGLSLFLFCFVLLSTKEIWNVQVNYRPIHSVLP